MKSRCDQLLARWVKVHKENPEIYEEFKHLADRVREHKSHYSAKTIIHVIRYHSDVRGNGTVKINNDWSPYYSRLYMKDRNCPKFFETRELLSAKKPAYEEDMDVVPFGPPDAEEEAALEAVFTKLLSQ